MRFVSGSKILAVAFISSAMLAPVHAATVVGGSALLDSTYANQLETWLGEGPLTLTNIFTRSGNTSFDFHAAADGKGRTFVVMRATESNGPSAIIGGYNPQSWSSIGDYNYTYDDADRTAFIFNLTNSEIRRQIKGPEDVTGLGVYQTYNDANYWPSFGSGDIFYQGGFSVGYSYAFSYGNVPQGTSLIDGSPFDGLNARFPEIEVFTISAAPVPEPETYAMMLAGLGLIGFVARRRKQTAV